MNKLIFLISLIHFSIAKEPINLFSKGPLFGKNYYLVQTPYITLPGVEADISSKSLKVSTIYNVSQGFKLNTNVNPDGQHLTFDYESSVFEIAIKHSPSKKFQWGSQMRVIGYYGGVLDSGVEFWHQLFNFPNGKREFFAKNRIRIAAENHNGIIFEIDNEVWSFGDIDLWGKFLLLDKNKLKMALMPLLKIPTGNPTKLSGSGYPDIGGGVLLDLYLHRYFSLFYQIAFIIPLNSIFSATSSPLSMFHSFISFEFNPTDVFSWIVQFNFKTSPIKGDYYYHNKFFNTRLDYLSSPQINTVVGVKLNLGKKDKNFLQIYLEEDSFTFAGTDFTFNFTYSFQIF